MNASKTFKLSRRHILTAADALGATAVLPVTGCTATTQK